MPQPWRLRANPTTLTLPLTLTLVQPLTLALTHPLIMTLALSQPLSPASTQPLTQTHALLLHMRHGCSLALMPDLHPNPKVLTVCWLLCLTYTLTLTQQIPSSSMPRRALYPEL